MFATLHLSVLCSLGQGRGGGTGCVGEHGQGCGGERRTGRNRHNSIPFCSDPILRGAGGLRRGTVSGRCAHAERPGARTPNLKFVQISSSPKMSHSYG